MDGYKNKIVNVTVIVFPDGQTCWLETDFETQEKDIRENIDLWKEKNKEKYGDSGISMAVCSVDMLKEDYENINTPFLG